MEVIDRLFNRRDDNQRGKRQNRGSRNVQEEETANNLIDEKAPSPLAIIYQSELDYLSRCVLDYPNIETGGQLFGFWSNQGTPVVLYVIGPGRYANHQPSFFNQDPEYLMTVGNELLDRYGLCHIGEWHSHHQLGLARPSGHDARTMHNGLIGIPARRLLLCICNYENGSSTVNAYNFHENDLRGYADAQWQIIHRASPFRNIVDHELGNLLIHPLTRFPSHGRNRVVQEMQPEPPSPPSPQPKIRIPAAYWVAQGNNLATLKKMQMLTKMFYPGYEVNTQADEGGIVQFHVAGNGKVMDVRFPEAFPNVGPDIYISDQKLAPEAEWIIPHTPEEIYGSYENWLKQLN